MPPGLRQSLRDILRSAWTRHPFVLIDSQPLSGTTRFMCETVKDMGPDTNMIVLQPAELVAAACSGAFDDLSPYNKHVVWLDELTPAGLLLLDREVVDIITVHAIMLGNITTRWRDLLASDTTALTAEARSILDEVVHPVHLPFALAEAERRRAQLLMPNVHIGVSIAASLVGADNLLRCYDYALPVFPAARKLAEVAVDIRRAGVHRGLTKRELYNVYARASTLRADARHEFEEAFEWVTKPRPNCATGVLRSVDEDRWTACSYVTGADDGDHGHPVRTLDEERLAVLRDELPADDAFNVAVAALLRGHRDIAQGALIRASEQCSDPVVRLSALRASELILR